MIYIRNLFTQDLRDGKQIAFPTEPSNLLFKFSFSNQDPDRKISFKFKVKDNTSPDFLHNDKTINTRLYSAGSESRIDGELKQFLRDILNAEVDDIILFRAISLVSYEFEFIPKGSANYGFYKTLLNGKNHEIIVRDIVSVQSDLIKSNKIREFLFDVFKFLQKEFGDAFLIEKSAIAKRKLAETNYDAYIFPDYFKTHPILGSFEDGQSEESLKTSNTLRYFPENLEILEQKYIYFTTQWGFPQFQHSPSFISFNKFVLDYSKNKYKIEYDEISQLYKLVLNHILEDIPQIAFKIDTFKLKTEEAGLIFSTQLIQRFVASLCTKPFVICSGLSGSGKTKLAQAFVQWITSDESQYVIVPVGADWTNREPLLGYPNALNKEEYVSPENGVLDLMIRAKQNIENIEEPTKPYFLILDEMNLSHVERYFADFLSTMESGDRIPLHKIENDSLIVPPSIKLPKNLFIIGTVNIDETTYMFSPKVLDRANTIEFRLTEKDLADFIASDKKLDMDLLKAQGANMSDGFIGMALKESDKNLKPSAADLKLFFTELKKSGAEFGYRTASEIGRLMYMLNELGETGDNLLDIAIMQKLLPKLHGSRNKLTKVLPILGGFCLSDNSKIKEDYLDKFLSNSLTEVELKEDSNVKYKISFEKICRMYKNAVENGFASYAEA
jgi:5-methylcytosine-specific restriction protein B